MRQVTHALLTRPPLGYLAITSFDLHVLGTPPAFILSQDRTLILMVVLSGLDNVDFISCCYLIRF